MEGGGGREGLRKVGGQKAVGSAPHLQCSPRAASCRAFGSRALRLPALTAPELPEDTSSFSVNNTSNNEVVIMFCNAWTAG